MGGKLIGSVGSRPIMRMTLQSLRGLDRVQIVSACSRSGGRVAMLVGKFGAERKGLLFETAATTYPTNYRLLRESLSKLGRIRLVTAIQPVLQTLRPAP